MKHNRRGFTLLEILIVVIIIGILATLAMPQFSKSIQKAKKSEAYVILGTMRSSILRYYQGSSPVSYPANINDLDVGVPTNSNYWTYTLEANGIAKAAGKTGTDVAGIELSIGPDGTTYGSWN